MVRNNQAVILYSGGTDSTCTAFLKTPEFSKIHLISYKRFGIFAVNNINYNFKKLQDLFSKDKFIRKTISIDKIYKLVVYDNYLKNIFNFGFFNLSVCGLCKLAMHIRTILYCIDNHIYTVFDGSNKNAGSGIATDQTKEVITAFTNLYKTFGIDYCCPVYEMESGDRLTWLSKLGFEPNEQKSIDVITTGTILNDIGFFESDNVKGAILDKKMQARCFQQFLSNIALNWYYIEKYGQIKYKNNLHRFFSEKTLRMTAYIKDYIANGIKSKLGKYKQ